jgi:ribonuclease PH
LAIAKRHDGRRVDALRPITIEPNPLKYPAGSVIISAGDTRILCTASVEPGVPPFLEGKGQGWLTSEYSMLPASTPRRKRREITSLRADSRGIEIKRLIGRALRAAVDLERMGENTIWLDCDVLQADGGTRTLSITGAWVALALAAKKHRKDGLFNRNPIVRQIAAVSVGVVEGRCMLDLNYREDSRADVDMNVVMTNDGRFIEVQGTAEAEPYEEAQLTRMLALARRGCKQLMRAQKVALK